MKRIFAVVMAVAFVFSVAGFAVAADNAVKPMKAAEKSATSAEKSAVSAEKSAAAADKSATDAKKSAKKAKSQQVTGTIEALDGAAGTFTVKGKKGNVDLKAGEKVKLGDFKVGDKVTVKYADGTASSVKAVKAAKAAKKSAAKAEKSADAAEKSAADAKKSAADAKKAAPAPAAPPAMPAEKK
jgi:colicin import membrane protein